MRFCWSKDVQYNAIKYPKVVKSVLKEALIHSFLQTIINLVNKALIFC